VAEQLQNACVAQRPALAAQCGIFNALVFVALLTLSGCASTPDPATLHRYNWWNYYQRGIYFLQQDNKQAAIEDFETCLGLRKGANFSMATDLWRIRTYGMHFIDGYFPHRELGIAHYRGSNYGQSIRFLELSLKQTPSGRAKTYLNRARKKSLKDASIPPPQTDFAPGSREIWTRSRRREIEGVARGNAYIEEISVNGRRRFIELAEQETEFRERIALSRGSNVVHVVARDLLGQETESKVHWIADWSPPHLVVHRIEEKKSDWTLTGVCLDDHLLNAITIDEKPLGGFKAGAGKSHEIRLTLPRDRATIFRAEDAAGNSLECMLALESFREDAVLNYAPQFAAAGESGSKLPTGKEDRLDPRLRISAQPQEAVFDEEFYLDGVAEDRGGLASIRINGEEFLENAGDGNVIRKYFSERLPLAPGTNEFEIAVTDVAGNETERGIVVVRKTPEYVRDEFRLSAGLPPFATRSEDQSFNFIRHRVEQELLRQPVRFLLVERDEGWDYILQEQKLSLSDLSESRAALRVRKMLPAELLLVGEVIPEDEGITIRMKVIDCEEGRQLAADDVYTENAREEIEFHAEGLVMKIEQRFPILEGRVTDRSGSHATIDLGDRHGAWLGARFLVLRAEDSSGDGAGGLVRTVDEIPIELRLSQAKSESGIAQIVPGSASGEIKEGDHVYSR